MEFSKPSIFYYFFLLIIPVLIHLFNFRKHKKIYFSSIYLLTEIIQRNKARHDIKRWMILLTRITSITLIILAFSLPYIRNNELIESKKIGLYIDNSFSMERTDDKNIKLITQAKKNAKTIIHELGENQQVLILINNFDKKYQKWYSKHDCY